MRRLFMLVSILALLALAAGADARALPAFDQLFLQSEARSSAYEQAIAQLAQSRAASPAVKAYADTLVQDHAGDAAALSDLAAKKGMTLQPGLTAQSKGALTRLAAYRGRRFDTAFLAEAHRVNGAATRAFRVEASRTADPDIRAFVAEQLAKDERHETAVAGLMGAPSPGMPVIRPPMTGAMPVLPPPSGGATPIIPPPR